MRYLIPAILLLSACNSAKQDSVVSNDSVAIAPADSVVIADEGLESSLYTIDDQVRQITFPFEGKTYDAQELLAIVFWPDQLDENTVGNDETPSGYSVNDAIAISGNFFRMEHSCESRTLLLTKRMEIDAEYYDLFFLEAEADGTPKVTDKISLDGSQGQSDTEVNVVTEALVTDKKCYALKVTSTTEGGDINLHRDSWVEYFVADAHGFHSAIKIITEETEVRDDEGTQTDSESSTSKLSEYKIETTSTHGLFDIMVNTVEKQNGKITSRSDHVYHFNGKIYE